MKCHPYLCVVLFWGLTACSHRSDADLEQAIAAIQGMTSTGSLSRSCYAVMYPDGQPSDFITFMFSDLGAPEWPVAMDEFEAEQMRSSGQVPLPNTVAISPLQRQNLESKEVVLTANNAEQKIQLHGYLANQTKPVLEVEFNLGKGVPSEDIAMICQSMLELGGSPR